MAESSIEWTEHTWNPVTGCTKVSPGCKHCYAETMARRLQAMGAAGYGQGFQLALHPGRLQQPLLRRRPTTYFGLSGFSCGSLHVDLQSKNGLTCGKANDMTTYSMVKKRYSTTALRSLRFVPDGSRMVKRGACRRELAEATSLDGQSWRVRPFEKGWRS